MNYQDGLASAYVNIGIIQTEQEDYNEGLKNLFASLKINENTGNRESIALCYDNIGIHYTKRKQFREAAYYLNKSLALSLEIGSMDNIKESYKDLAKMDSAAGNYHQALQHYKLYITYRDSLFNEENTRKLVQSQMQYDFDKKEDSLQQQHFITETKLQAQHKQKYFYWGGLAMLAALAFFVFLNFRNQKKINKLAGNAHAKEKAELELQSLRAQLNPHFMFNSLNAIQELILLEENEKSQSYLARFAKLLRMLLENADKPFIPLQREIDFLQLYLSLENLRIPDLEHSITIDPAIDTEQTMIPNMILQPYIENAIWHGLSHKQSDRKLWIRVTKTNGIVQYAIEDNGVGRKKSAELKSLFRKEHKSKGMELLSKRFKLLAKEYGSDIETTITDIINNEAVSGTLVTIRVPVAFSGKIKTTTS
ncbi:MAG: histidine kinase [Bacteroidota bacterium]